MAIKFGYVQSLEPNGLTDDSNSQLEVLDTAGAEQFTAISEFYLKVFTSVRK
jgi:hypothetical protein